MQTNPDLAEPIKQHQTAPNDWRATVRAAGLVFGDIGTSPIYTLTIIFLLLPSSRENILGVVSLILWTLVVIVFWQYVFLAMKLDHSGEGGTLILKRIAEQYVRPENEHKIFDFIIFLLKKLKFNPDLLPAEASGMGGQDRSHEYCFQPEGLK